MGYPKNIEFTSEGGEINVSGDRRLSSFEIYPDGKTIGDSLYNFIYENDWLIIKPVDDPDYDVATSKFIFIAKPLTGEKKRKEKKSNVLWVCRVQLHNYKSNPISRLNRNKAGSK